MDRKCLAAAFFHGHCQQAFMPMLGVWGLGLSFSFHLPFRGAPVVGYFCCTLTRFSGFYRLKISLGHTTVTFSFFSWGLGLSFSLN